MKFPKRTDSLKEAGNSSFMTLQIGILGLQGCCKPHELKLKQLNVQSTRVIYPEQLFKVDALIIPGGESSTMLKTQTSGLWQALLEFGQSKTIWGICAGSILLSKKTINPEQDSLGLLDIDITRNAYGAQNESFIKTIEIQLNPTIEESCIFIRAPKISRTGVDINHLAYDNGNVVMLENELHMASTFHPELGQSNRIHQYFLEKAIQG